MTDSAVLGLLGPLVLYHGLFHHYLASLAIPCPGHRIARTDLWRHSILRHLHVRPLLQEHDLLPPRGILLLVLLFLYELHLDRDSWV